MSLLFGLASTQARHAFVNKCVSVYGLAPESLYTSDFGDYVVVENLSPDKADMLRAEPEVVGVFDNESLQPF